MKKDYKIKYSIEYHKGLDMYVLWAEINSKTGFCVKGIYHGTRKECQQRLNEIKLVNN